MIVEVEHQRHDVDLIKIDNDETKIVFSNYGARIVSWKYHDNNIILGNVVEADEFYFENPFNFGATIGRYAGRIKDSSFKLDGQTYVYPGLWSHHEYDVGYHCPLIHMFDHLI